MSTRHSATLAVAVSLAVIAAACTGGDSAGEPPPDTATPPPATEADTEAPVPTEAPDTTEPAAASGDEAVQAAAANWLENESGLDANLVAQLTPARTIAAGPVSHVTFEQMIEGRRIRGAEITVHVQGDGGVQGATTSLTNATPGASDATLDEAGAVGIAVKAVDGTVDGEPRAELIWAQVGTNLVPAWLVSLSTRGPIGSWQVVIDGNTSVVLATDRGGRTAHGVRQARPSKIGASVPALPARQAGDACDVPAAPSACVFLNPFAVSGAPVNPSDANSFLRGVELTGLNASDQLRGEYVDTAFDGSPIVPDPEPDGTWAAGVGSRNFEAAMSYYWLDRTQRLMQELGFSIRADEPTRIIPLSADEVDNAFFDGNENLILMGVGSNGIHAAHDAAVLVHEYGHAVLDAQVGTDTHFSSEQIGSYSEGFGDLLAGLTMIELRASDPACMGGWFGSPNECFRRLDTDRVAPQDLTREVHDDGELFAGAVWDIFEGLLAAEGLTPGDCYNTDACTAVRNRLLSVILGSHYYFVPGATFFDISNAYLRSNDSGFGGANRDVFEAGFAAHGLLGDSGTSLDPTGQGTDTTTGTVSVGIDIAHDYRGDLTVSVGVVDAAYEFLCDEVPIAVSDPEDDGDNLVGTIDISDTACAAFVPPSPDQLWYLYAADELADDEGQLIEFVVYDGDNPYPAGGLPLNIPDGDPDGVFAFVDGIGSVVPEEDQVEPGAPVDGQPFVSLDITHTYNGDLSVRAGVADGNDDIVCSVPIQNPDPADDSGGLFGDVDMSECAAFYPPAADRQWFLQVIDTALEDVGTVDLYSLTGPDGAVFDFIDVPVEVPDNSEDGVALLLSDTGGSNGQAGGSGQSSTLELPAVSVEINHAYAGDLAVTAGVATADLDVLCEVIVRTSDPADDTVDLVGDVSLAECAEFYPPSPDQQWYLYVRDTLSDDIGVVSQFTLTGPDGKVFNSPDVGLEIPDADQDGIALFLTGSESAPGAGETIAGYVISHTYVGDLYIEMGVLDANDELLCGVVVREPDLEDSSVDLADQVDLSECSAFYPPSPDQIWYMFVEDTGVFDEGTLDAFLLGGPDGDVRDADNVLPGVIPDNSADGFIVFFDS